MTEKLPSFWQKAKSTGKAGFDKAWQYTDKLGAPVNKLSNKLGSEAFWPTSIDKESEKASRILRSFCKDGFYEEELYQTPEGPKAKQQVIKKIPANVIKNAKGLAIFTTMRSGLWFSGAGGSGILIGRNSDGEWGSPAGIMLHTAGLGFLVGIDIYDCVLVINTEEALSAFSKWRCTLGGEISAVAGPAGVGGVVDSEVHKRQSPVFTYLKSRGFYAGIQVDGTVIIERSDENARFYGGKISATDILAGRVPSRTHELKMLHETLKSAQGDKDADLSFVPNDPPPADYEVEEEGHIFGVPDRDDPDPYGVLALEKEGLGIKDAGTKQYVATDDFEFKPHISSPVHSSFRRSTDSISRRESWRRSNLSTATATSRNYATSDVSTQTDLDGPPPYTKSTKVPPPLPPRGRKDTQSSLHSRSASDAIAEVPTESNPDPDGYEQSKVHTPSPSYQATVDSPTHSMATSHSREPSLAPSPQHSSPNSPQQSSQTSPQPNLSMGSPAKSFAEPLDSPQATSGTLEDTKEKPALTITTDASTETSKPEHSDHDTEDEALTVHSVQVHQATTPQRINKPRLVSVPKRVAPKLPQRNPGRVRDAIARMDSADSGNMTPLSPKGETTLSKESSVTSIGRESPERSGSPVLEKAPPSPQKHSEHLTDGMSSRSRASSFKSADAGEEEETPIEVTKEEKHEAKNDLETPKEQYNSDGPRVSLAGIRGGLREDDDEGEDDFA